MCSVFVCRVYVSVCSGGWDGGWDELSSSSVKDDRGSGGFGSCGMGCVVDIVVVMGGANVCCVGGG